MPISNYFDSAFYMNFGDGSTTGYYAVAKRPQNTAVAAGILRRQFTTPAVGNERVFVCIVAGTTANTTDATWTLTRGALTTDGTATWQECSGVAGVNSDVTNTMTWDQARVRAEYAQVGAVIKRNNGVSLQIAKTVSFGAFTAVAEPAFSDTAGVTTTDATGVVWTSLGPVGGFAKGAAPIARFNNVWGTNWFGQTNTVYIASTHNETACPNPGGPFLGATQYVTNKILCHNPTGSYPPSSSDLTTGAVIATASGITFAFQPNEGPWYFYGITFRVGVGGTTTPANITMYPGNNYSQWMYFERCSFELMATAASPGAFVSAGGYNVQRGPITIWNNCTVRFGSSADYVSPCNGQFVWKNTGPVLVAGSAVPAFLFRYQNIPISMDMTLEALDLSQVTTSFAAIASGGQTPTGSTLVKDCKLHASMTSTMASSPITMMFQYVRSDSAATNYKSSRYDFEGTETTETTITRVGGATDPSGQVQSRKIVTTAYAHWLRPFKAQPYAAWNATTAANVTATVYGVTASGGLPLSDEIWAEFEYLGSASSSLGTIVTTTKANVLATGAAVASDGSTWGGGVTPFKLTATFSSPQPGQAGYIHARVRAAKASATFYIDPQVYLS